MGLFDRLGHNYPTKEMNDLAEERESKRNGQMNPDELTLEQLDLIGNNADLENNAQLLNRITKQEPDTMREIAEERSLGK